MEEVHIINNILVPEDMIDEAELIRSQYNKYFSKQNGFVGSTFYKSRTKEEDGSTKYINIVVWSSMSHAENVVNAGFDNEAGGNKEGMRVLGKGFPAPIVVSPAWYQVVAKSE